MSEPYFPASLPKSVPKYFGHLLSTLTPQDVRQLLEEFRDDLPTRSDDKPLPSAALPWQEWLRLNFPHVCAAPMGERHNRLWEWFEALEPGVRPRPRVEVWPRGGAKSTTTELGVARSCVRLSRRYALYVSETQEQADKHIGSIASLLETAGVERSLNKYGSSKGWRRQELRTANGFNVSAYGLDTAARGVKLDAFRPDLIIFDDIDSQDDSARTTEKKIAALTTAIIPAGSVDCAMLFLQNMIHEESIFAQLCDGRADFLHDREPACVEPAVRGLQTEKTDRGDGLNVYRIAAGEATWAGQSLATCEAQINAWGLRAFLREAQHEVAGAAGWFFDVSQLKYCSPVDVPQGLRYCRAWDLAATQDGGDWTVGALVGLSGTLPDVRVYVRDVTRGQWSADRVEREIAACAACDPPGTLLRLPQDPGQAGKAQAAQFRETLKKFNPIILPVTGPKGARATGFAEAVNLGNVTFSEDREWNHPIREELRKFREDVTDQQDDAVDALADAFNQLARAAVRLRF